MRRDDSFVASGSQQHERVVHVVGLLTDQVCGFLEPATQAVARTGGRQSVVLIDVPRYRANLARLPESVQLVLADGQGHAFQQWRALHRACREVLDRGAVRAVHLHGLLPTLVGMRAVRASGIGDVPTFFSPYGVRTPALLGSLSLAARALLRTRRGAAILHEARDSSAFDDWPVSELLESPVSETFFAVPRNEARHPLIVTGGRVQSVRSAELFAQAAVLLAGEDIGVSFNWLGEVDELTRKRLNAAGVGVFEIGSDEACAARLAAGWIYLAPGAPTGFPMLMVEAMAVGLPCVATDCDRHRELLIDGETGFLCGSEREMIERIAQLIDEPAVRERIGRAGQALARARFAESLFSSRLLATYGKPR